MSKTHNYNLALEWTGNLGIGTKSYTSYSREYSISVDGKETIKGSSDSAFRGDPTLHNPEELFLASIASCHMLWYLHLCAVNAITVILYNDNPIAQMEESSDGGGKFTSATLSPKVKILEVEKTELAKELHKEANKKCFIANSCNFPIKHDAEILVQDLNS